MYPLSAHPARLVRGTANRFLSLTLLAAIAAGSADAEVVEHNWTVKHNTGTITGDDGKSIATTPSGDIYIAATSYDGTSSSPKLLLIKLRPDGTYLWDKTIDAALHFDGRMDLAVDSQGNALVAAATRIESNWALSIWKIDAADGGILWDHHHDDVGECLNSNITNPAVAIDAADHVYAAACDMTVFKYASDGSLMWTRSGVPTALDGASDMVVAPDGSIRVAGVNDAGFNRFGAVAYDAAGNLLWDDDRTGPIGAIFGPARVAIGPAGETVVATEVESTCGVGALQLVRFTPAGAFDWVLDYPPTPCDNYKPAGVAIDSAGQIDVTASRGGSSNIVLTQFDTNGVMAWERSYDGPLNSTDTALDLALDREDNCYVLGSETAGAQNRDFVVLKYSASGALAWKHSYDGGVSGNEFPAALAVDRCGRAYAAGYGWAPPGGSHVYVLRYTQLDPGDVDTDGDVDLVDFQIVQQNFGQASGAVLEDGDIDGDGDVDADDLTLFTSAQTAPCP